MTRFFTVYLYWVTHFLHKINSLGTKIKKTLMKYIMQNLTLYIYIYIYI